MIHFDKILNWWRFVPIQNEHVEEVKEFRSETSLPSVRCVPEWSRVECKLEVATALKFSSIVRFY